MPRVKKLDLGMTALDELFMNDKERAENKFREYSPFRLCIAATLSATGLPVPSPVF